MNNTTSSAVIGKKNIIKNIAYIAALIASLSVPSYAFSASSDTKSSSLNAVKEYPEMTEEDCHNLSSKSKKYKKSEYQSRKEYCDKMNNMGTKDSAAEKNKDKEMDNSTDDKMNNGAMPK